MKPKGLIIILIITASALYPSGVQENKVYIEEKEEDRLSGNIPLPDFLRNNQYDYGKETGGDSAWHTFTIGKDNEYKVARKQEIYENLENIIPEETSYVDVVNRYGLPPQVIIAESGIGSEKQYYHLNFVYDELSLYFGTGYEELREIRIEDSSDYTYKGISFNHKLDDLLELYPPVEIVDGEEIDWDSSAVLYKNAGGRKGFYYIDYKELNIRLFLYDEKISAFYIY